jgi:cell division protease FtsH
MQILNPDSKRLSNHTNKDIMNKKMLDFTEEDCSRLAKEFQWNNEYSQYAIREWLGVEKSSDVRTAEHGTSVPLGLVLRYAMTDWLEKNGYIIDRTTYLGRDGEYSAGFSNVEHEPKKSRSCLSNGSLLFSKGKDHYVYTVEPTQDGYHFKVIGKNIEGAKSPQALLDSMTEYAHEHNFLRGKKIDANCSFISFNEKYTWDSLILSPKLKKDLHRNISNLIDNTEVYAKNNLTVKRGLIFHGKPGTGKSLLGKILCSTIDWTFVWVTPRHLIYPKNISNIVGICRDLAPTVLFLEDLDLYGGDRESNRGNGGNALLGELMNQLDGIQENKNIITIATTNNKDVLEKALLDRPGRFDKVLEFPPPNEECRIMMIKAFLKKIKLHEDVKLEDLGKATQELTGAHIKELVHLAILHAVDEKSWDENKLLTLKKDHFTHALAGVSKKDFKKLGFEVANKVNDDDEYGPCPGDY